MNQIVQVEENPSISSIERVIIAGDLSKMDPKERVTYYLETCKSLGLNPLTKPFELITLNGKMVLYATRTATDQLRAINKISIKIVSREKRDGVYVVTAQASTPDGRIDESTGVVSVGNIGGDALANMYMKAETKAKRRVTLSIVGLGWMDESETDSIAGAKKEPIQIDQEPNPVVFTTGLSAPIPAPTMGEVWKFNEGSLAVLKSVCKRADWDGPKMRQECAKLYNGRKENELTKEEFSKFIDYIDKNPVETVKVDPAFDDAVDKSLDPRATMGNSK